MSPITCRPARANGGHLRSSGQRVGLLGGSTRRRSEGLSGARDGASSCQEGLARCTASCMWAGITGLVEELKRCEAAGVTAAALVLAYVCIDTMAYLSLPPDKSKQTRLDFIAWVDAYLKGHPDQPYQYRGIDVYAARCAVLHAFSSEAERHRENPDVRVFGYHDGGQHRVDPAQASRLVLIGTASFLNDVVLAVERFLKACLEDAALRARVETRLPRVLQTFPIKAEEDSR